MAESSYIIITTYGPEADDKNTLRGKLHDLYLKGIEKIQYKNYRVFLFGHLPDKTLGKIQYIQVAGQTKEQKLNQAKIYLIDNVIKSDYILRLDDDDIINPLAFQKVNALNCDVYTDEYHTFLDFETGKIAQKKRDWFPNTTILKYELAFENLFLDNSLFFNYEHSYWHYFLKEKSDVIQYSSKGNPLYIRVLNKASITSNLDGKNVYANYLQGFGNWQSKQFKNFTQIISN